LLGRLPVAEDFICLLAHSDFLGIAWPRKNSLALICEKRAAIPMGFRPPDITGDAPL
jgi:hypothetical protein